MTDPGESVIFGIKSHDATARSMGVFDFKGGIQTVCFATDIVAGGLEAGEEVADVVVGLILCIGEFRVRPNLDVVSMMAISVVPLRTFWFISLSCASY